MKHPLLSRLCCPSCKRSLSQRANSLYCQKCVVTYPIKNGIPVLVNLKSLSSHLRRQVRYFEEEDTCRPSYILEPWQARYVENFLSWGRPKVGGLIVDNATGSGYMAIELAKRGFRVIATDLTFAELVKLKKNAQKLGLTSLILPVCANSEELPVKTETGNGLVANAILEHLPNEEHAIREITRVIKSGSPVMVAMPIAYHLLLPFFWFPNWMHDRRIGHLRRYDRATILQKLSGFREITTYYTGHLIKIVCLVLFFLTKNNQWNKRGETWDRLFASFPYGANNIVSVLRKT